MPPLASDDDDMIAVLTSVVFGDFSIYHFTRMSVSQGIRWMDRLSQTNCLANAATI